MNTRKDIEKRQKRKYFSGGRDRTRKTLPLNTALGLVPAKGWWFFESLFTCPDTISGVPRGRTGSAPRSRHVRFARNRMARPPRIMLNDSLLVRPSARDRRRHRRSGSPSSRRRATRFHCCHDFRRRRRLGR